MIQRLQSLYLVLASAALIGFLAVYESWAYAIIPSLSNIWPAVLVGVFFGAAAVVALAAMFLYKDRPRQRKAVVMTQWVVVLGVAALVGGFFISGNQLEFTRLSTIVLPLAAYVLLWLARKRIEKDIELVRSMDRLR